MKKVTGYRRQWTVLIFILILLPVACCLMPVQAKDSTSAAVLTRIQQKLEDLKQEIASKAAQIKSEISQKISNKAYVGIISQIQDQPNASASAKLITLTSSKGTRVVAVNDYTVFQDLANPKKVVTLKNFGQGDYVAALGDVDDNLVLTAKKIVKTKPPQTTQVTPVWGQILSVSPSMVSVLNKDNKKVNLTLSANTDFKVASDEATLKDVIPGNFLVSISNFIYLINPNGDLKIAPKPSASSSASPSASPKKK